MSNANVGAVYAQIINDVLEAVNVDFEEGGVDPGVANELKLGWQRRLTSLNVATFPWDSPKPSPTENASTNSTPAAPQQVPPTSYTQAQLSPQATASPLPMPGQHYNGLPTTAIKTEPGIKHDNVPIKQEPGLHNGQMPSGLPSHPGPGRGPYDQPHQATGGPGANSARARAIENLRNTYGERAEASINNFHKAAQAQQPHMTPQQQAYQRELAARHAAQMAQQHAQYPMPGNIPNGLPTSQMDGVTDNFEGVMVQRGNDGESVSMGRVEVDRLLHEQLAARAKQMEGGGLMLPLKEVTKHKSIATTRADSGDRPQVDGADDDVKEERKEENPEDAINSDLDDPDDEQEDDDEDDEGTASQLMLCTYDKVQRVKNKWKCTLKDGVLTVNGKEYVFHKATGEYEW